MHDAAAKGDIKKLETFLDGNYDRTTKEPKFGNTPLHECASRGYSRCCKLLCSKFNVKNEKKDKTKKGTSLETKSALQAAVLSIRNNEGNTPLHLAAQNGHNQSCRELLLAGTDPDLQNNVCNVLNLPKFVIHIIFFSMEIRHCTLLVDMDMLEPLEFYSLHPAMSIKLI